MQIKSYWTYETGKWNEETNSYIDRKVSEPQEKILEVRYLTKDKPIVKFIGGPTGYESYYLEDLLNNPLTHKDFCICGGTINSWARCWIKTKDFIEILEVFKYES